LTGAVGFVPFFFLERVAFSFAGIGETSVFLCVLAGGLLIGEHSILEISMYCRFFGVAAGFNGGDDGHNGDDDGHKGGDEIGWSRRLRRGSIAMAS
jgi:hypothetical protein